MKKKWKYLVGIILVLALLLLIISRILKPKEEIETKALPTVTTEKLKKAGTLSDRNHRALGYLLCDAEAVRRDSRDLC